MKIGKYRHYKGNEYEVIGIGRDTDALEEVVIYRALYDSPDFGRDMLWVRKKSEFESVVEKNGKVIPRFEYIG